MTKMRRTWWPMAAAWLACTSLLLTGCATQNAGFGSGVEAFKLFGPNEFGSYEADDVLMQHSDGSLYFSSADR